MEEGRNTLEISTVRPTVKRTSGRNARRWKDNIRMDLKGIVINPVGCIRFRIEITRVLVKTKLNLWVP